MNAILSIKPKYINEIIEGRKTYEFRKRIFQKPVKKVYIYASRPVCRIIGEFKLGRIQRAKPEELWNTTHLTSGISKTDFDNYFLNYDIGYALEIKNFKKYPTPINPYLRIEGFRAPQSFCYIDELRNE